MPWCYVGQVRFETPLPLLMAISVALLGAAVLVGAWYVGAAAATAGESVPPASLIVTAGYNFGQSR